MHPTNPLSAFLPSSFNRFLHRYFPEFQGSRFAILPPFPLSRFKNLLLFSLLLLSPSAFADGGAVLRQEVVGPYRVTLFGSPSPLRAGPADLSVLLQDAKTGAPVLGEPVAIKVQATASAAKSEAWVPPCCSMTASPDTVTATHAAAQNKLLYAANLLIPASGPHEITVTIGNAPAQFSTVTPQRIEPPAPPLASYWAYLAFPPLVVAGFALNQRLRRRT